MLQSSSVRGFGYGSWKYKVGDLTPGYTEAFLYTGTCTNHINPSNPVYKSEVVWLCLMNKLEVLYRLPSASRNWRWEKNYSKTLRKMYKIKSNTTSFLHIGYLQVLVHSVYIHCKAALSHQVSIREKDFRINYHSCDILLYIQFRLKLQEFPYCPSCLY